MQWQFDLYNKSDGAWPEWNPENKTAKGTWRYTAYLARSSSHTGKHGRFRTACNWRHGPVLALWPGTRPDCNWYMYMYVVLCLHCLLFYSSALVYTIWLHRCLMLLLLCLPLAANFYIVVSQDVVTVAVVLEMRACVGRDQYLSFYVACYSQRGISTYVLWFTVVFWTRC